MPAANWRAGLLARTGVVVLATADLATGSGLWASSEDEATEAGLSVLVSFILLGGLVEEFA